MKTAKNLVYDGSFNGFLSAVFTAYEQKLEVADIVCSARNQNNLFADTEIIFTNIQKAKRTWKGIEQRNPQAIKTIYFAFLSEAEGVEKWLYRYIDQLVKDNTGKGVKDFSDPVVLKINQLAKSVGREKHRMEAFVRFNLTKDGLYFSNIEPDFDVLPLISKHFRLRYADQEWLIYDLRRKYGLYYDGNTVSVVSLDLDAALVNSAKTNRALSEEEHQYSDLWAQYFKSTNIKSRVNQKLHVRHVPKRYWKYLNEKRAV